jgi:asparagine synthetase B (glutamine-hydrolysing)
MRQIGPLDANFGWDGASLYNVEHDMSAARVPARLRGACASVHITDGRARVVRDPLGINKLFWAPGADGELRFAARPQRLVQDGCSFERVRAVPPGTAIDLNNGATEVRTLQAPQRPEWSGDSLESIAQRIRSTLDDYCAALAAVYPRTPVYVCLSGGLDSSAATVLARRHFADVTAVSFDLDRDGAPPSADRLAAERFAADLGMPLLTVTATVESVLDGLDTALAEGIDWRDFNVHAALVNVALARGIAEHCAVHHPDSRPLVLTGDLANEYVCDYKAEQYRGETYYALPRLSPAALQWALIRGVETSHREVGPFQAYDLPVVQVYAPAVDHYLSLSEDFLADPARKDRLCQLMFGDLLPDYIYGRPKTRAQVGDAETGRGVLGACVDNGIDRAWLKQRFSQLHGVSDPSLLDRFIRAGRYRSSVPTPGDDHR